MPVAALGLAPLTLLAKVSLRVETPLQSPGPHGCP